MTLVAEDRVELVTTGHQGTIEHVDHEHVRVRWDDGKTGLLYYDAKMIPQARYLQRLRKHEPA